MQIMIFGKTRPATLEKHVTIAIIPHFYFIRSFITGHLSQNSFMKLTTIHELREFYRKALLVMALSTSKREKKNKFS
jgi:hypothetical protein